MSEEEIKTFSDLQREVHQRGLCGKCGGCVSFCSAGKCAMYGQTASQEAFDSPKYRRG